MCQIAGEQPRMYGYEITRMVEELSESNIQLTEGALYPALHKLEAQGLFQSEKVNIGKNWSSEASFYIANYKIRW